MSLSKCLYRKSSTAHFVSQIHQILQLLKCISVVIIYLNQSIASSIFFESNFNYVFFLLSSVFFQHFFLYISAVYCSHVTRLSIYTCISRLVKIKETCVQKDVLKSGLNHRNQELYADRIAKCKV